MFEFLVGVIQLGFDHSEPRRDKRLVRNRDSVFKISSALSSRLPSLGPLFKRLNPGVKPLGDRRYSVGDDSSVRAIHSVFNIGDALANRSEIWNDCHTSVCRRHRPVIRHRLRKRLVIFVPNRNDRRCRTISNRPNGRFLVETPQIRVSAPTTRHHNHIDRRVLL
jgi:hypothetical protein